MMIQSKRQFVARTIYHHGKRTGEYVTLLVYNDLSGAYELRDDREAEHDFLSGDEEYIFQEWGKKNRQLIEGGFQRDDMMGYDKWQQFIS
jgi:hypothetical protein